MKSEFNFNEVMNRVKKTLKIKHDYELAELLNMSAASFNGRKKTDSIPYEAILALANKEKIDFNWLLTGNDSTVEKSIEANGVVEMHRHGGFGLGAANESVSEKMAEMMELFARLDDKASEEAIYATQKIVENCEVRQRLMRIEAKIGQQAMAA